MKAKQLELLPPHSYTHRYQILDALWDSEEAHSDTARNAPLTEPPAVSAQPQVPNAFTHHYGLPSANPYSRIKEEDSNSGISPKLLSEISASLFEREAKRILRQYSPTVGVHRRLRPEFKSFVANHKTKPSASRAQILAELKKYDLSASGFAEPFFNREMSDRVLKQLLRLGDQ